jgi:hypothetical protein
VGPLGDPLTSTMWSGGPSRTSQSNVYVAISDSSGNADVTLTASRGPDGRNLQRLLRAADRVVFGRSAIQRFGLLSTRGDRVRLHSAREPSFDRSTHRRIPCRPSDAATRSRRGCGTCRTSTLPEDVAVFEVLFRQGVPHGASGGADRIARSVPYIVEQAYYAVENESTQGARHSRSAPVQQQHTRLSYGGELETRSSFFMSNLHAGNAYRIIFLVYEHGRQQVIDGRVQVQGDLIGA